MNTINLRSLFSEIIKLWFMRAWLWHTEKLISLGFGRGWMKGMIDDRLSKALYNKLYKSKK